VRGPSIGHLVAAGQGQLWAAGGELPRGVRWVAAGRRGDDTNNQPDIKDDPAMKLKPMDNPLSADPSLTSKKGDY
jgi:hypothetical protein